MITELSVHLSGVFKMITVLRSEQRYFDLETCAEPWNPPLREIRCDIQEFSPENVKSFACTTMYEWTPEVHHCLKKHDITVLHHMALSGYNVLCMQWCHETILAHYTCASLGQTIIFKVGEAISKKIFLHRENCWKKLCKGCYS